MREDFSDAIVVGAGPCGSFAALNMAKLGLSVNVLEEHADIGIPCHCAGHISVRGLKLLGLHPLPSKIIENAFCGAIFHSARGTTFRAKFPSPVTYSVNRSLFDKYIADIAERAGVRYHLDSRAESLIIENGFVKGVIARQGETKKVFLSEAVVDAEGISSRILRQSGLSPFDADMLVKAVEAEAENVRNIETDFVEVFLDKRFVPYAWLMPKQDGKAKVGLAVKNGNLKELLQRFMVKHPTASRKMSKARITKTVFHSITLGGPIPRTFSDGFLVVGDAASQVKPTTGGGVFFGMACAKIAAEIIWEASCRNDFSSDLLHLYQKQCNKMFGHEFKFMLIMRKMLDSLPDEKIDDILGFCRRIGLNKALQSFSDLDFQGRSFIRALLNPRVPVALSYFFLSCLLGNR